MAMYVGFGFRSNAVTSWNGKKNCMMLATEVCSW